MIREKLGNEKGVALVATILVGAVMILMVAGLTAYGIKSQNISRRDQDWNAALSSAEAGVDDYIYRLNQNTTYYAYGAGTTPPDGNTAFTQWAPVPGGDAEGQFRYTPNSSNFLTSGIIELTSSGRVNGEVRTIHTLLRRRAFIDFLYFTIYETKDPARYTGSGEFTVAQANAQCGEKYFYPPDARSSGCADINFISADVIDGPMHTNDAMLVCGSPDFLGQTTTKYPGAGSPLKLYRTNTQCPTTPAPFFLPGYPQVDDDLNFPASNSALRAAADPALGGDGCVYTGPTSIRLLSTGQMVVNSPFTRVRTQPACAGPATRSATFTPAPPQTVNLPPNGVVYVQGVPGDPSDPNFSTATQLNTRCPTTTLTSGGPDVTIRQNPLGYPKIGPGDGYDITPGYGCSDGDAFVAGTLNGQLTIGASDTIIAAAYNSANSTSTSAVNMDQSHGSEDIRYNSTAGNTVLGLAANIYVEVYHPIQTRDDDLNDEMLNDDNITIQAAMLSLLHSFVVQNYNRGESHNLLTVRGAIAQRYRGPVGTFSGSSTVTGYTKDYHYDTRLRFLSPPSWVSPVESQWRVKTFSELQPAF